MTGAMSDEEHADVPEEGSAAHQGQRANPAGSAEEAGVLSTPDAAEDASTEVPKPEKRGRGRPKKANGSPAAPPGQPLLTRLRIPGSEPC